MKNNVETQLRRLLRKTSGLDIMVLRLSVIFIFALFGTYKWFAFEANALHHLLPGTWLGALYPALGVQGLSYALGVVENITLLALIAGFFRPAVGAAGALMVAGTGIVTLTDDDAIIKFQLAVLLQLSCRLNNRVRVGCGSRPMRS